jgi:hypothetical protein
MEKIIEDDEASILSQKSVLSLNYPSSVSSLNKTTISNIENALQLQSMEDALFNDDFSDNEDNDISIIFNNSILNANNNSNNVIKITSNTVKIEKNILIKKKKKQSNFRPQSAPFISMFNRMIDIL